jgi:hypothetical protein
MGKDKDKGEADGNTDSGRARPYGGFRNSQTNKGSPKPLEEVSRTVPPPRRNDNDDRDA